MNHGRRNVLGMALLGMIDPLMAATPASSASAAAMPAALKTRLDRELAAIVANPACELASLSVLAIRDGRIAYEAQ